MIGYCCKNMSRVARWPRLAMFPRRGGAGRGSTVVAYMGVTVLLTVLKACLFKRVRVGEGSICDVYRFDEYCVCVCS